MIVKNTEILDVEKLQYLNMSATGEAAQLIRKYEVTDENFARAWQELVDRYENKRVLIDTHLSTLFSLQKVTQQSPTGLKALVGEVKESLGALSALGCPTDAWDNIIVYMVTRKLDSESLLDWEMQIGATTEPATFEKLQKFISGRIHALEGFARATATQKSRSAAPAATKNTSGAKSHQTTAPLKSDNSPNAATISSSFTCSLCNAAHYLSACPMYRGKPVAEKLDFLKQKNLCFNCLGPHQFRNCRTAKRCRVCGNPHHTSIHRTINSSDGPAPRASATQGTSSQPKQSVPIASGSQTSASALPRREDTESSVPASTNVALTSSTKYMPVLLATALIKVTSCYGDQYEVRALLDQESEVSFITESLAQRINLPRQRVSLPIHGIGAQRSSVARGFMNLSIASRVNPTFSLSIGAYVLAKLTSYLPSIRVVKKPWPHLDGLELADPEFSSTTQIDLILGAEVYSLILEEGLRRGGPGTPIAQQTALGWILSGSVASESAPDQNARPAQGLQCSVDHDLLDLVQRFWAQEDTTVESNGTPSDAEAQCEQHFIETHSRQQDGRYVVRIPLKRLPEDLGDSYKPALYALSRQEKRFAANSSLKSAYTEFLNEYEALGHMALVPKSSVPSRRVFYLPHHAVVRETSSTSRIRVVFNGSHRTNFGISINDLQHIGPKLQTDLADVITRWRRYAYVFSADIEKMYRQIRVHPEDWDLQRILWRDNPENPPLSYHLSTVTYGLASAPYLAIRTLQQLSIDEEQRFPLATSIIKHEIYVDDVLSGADDIAETQEKIRQIDECLKAGCFTLQKWTASDEQLLALIPSERREKSSSVLLEDAQLFRALGLLWQPHTDSFVFASHSCDEPPRISKRTVLSRVAQLFDPLGWIAPVVVRGKIFIQELWSAKLGWDDQLPEELECRWRTFDKDLQDVSSISVPRWLGSRASSCAVELHGFSDASQVALGAVIYLRAIADLDDVRVTIVAAKTRVAPLKPVTIPRLELSAALLLVRTISHVRKTLDLEEAPIHLWTDSTVALAYVRGDARRWADYVRNRVTEIQELSNSQWHHVPGKDNPADFASRGLSPRQLKDETLWWNGPTWLWKHSTSWPSSNPSLDTDVALEIRKTPVAIANKNEPPEIWALVERFSNLRTLLRVTALCFRAVHKFKRIQGTPDRASPFTPEELNTVRLVLGKENSSRVLRERNSSTLTRQAALAVCRADSTCSFR